MVKQVVKQVAKKIATKAVSSKGNTKVEASKTVEHRVGSWAATKTVKVEVPGNGASIIVSTKPDDTVYSKLEQVTKLGLYRKLFALKKATIGDALEKVEGLTKGQLKRFAQWGYIKFGKAS